MPWRAFYILIRLGGRGGIAKNLPASGTSGPQLPSLHYLSKFPWRVLRDWPLNCRPEILGQYMPRKSAADLSVIPLDPGVSRLKPPSTLSEPERTVFVDVVSTNKPQHF